MGKFYITMWVLVVIVIWSYLMSIHANYMVSYQVADWPGEKRGLTAVPLIKCLNWKWSYQMDSMSSLGMYKFFNDISIAIFQYYSTNCLCHMLYELSMYNTAPLNGKRRMGTIILKRLKLKGSVMRTFIMTSQMAMGWLWQTIRWCYIRRFMVCDSNISNWNRDTISTL